MAKDSKKEVKEEPTAEELLEELNSFVKKEAEDEDIYDDIEEEELMKEDKDVEMIRKEVEMKLWVSKAEHTWG